MLIVNAHFALNATGMNYNEITEGIMPTELSDHNDVLLTARPVQCSISCCIQDWLQDNCIEIPGHMTMNLPEWFWKATPSLSLHHPEELLQVEKREKHLIH